MRNNSGCVEDEKRINRPPPPPKKKVVVSDIKSPSDFKLKYS